MKLNPPELELLVGMELHRSDTEGIGGRIKQIPEDFIVEEITPEGRVLEVDGISTEGVGEGGEYLHFTLQKYNWDTMRAVKVISNRLKVGRKRFGFAGTKDKRALTTQRVSVWSIGIEEMQKVRIRDISMGDFRYSDERITLGNLWGNRFTVIVRDLNLDKKTLKNRFKSISDELDNRIPNFFGVQRFGTVRPITHQVGEWILRRDFRKAVMIYLSKIYEGESEESREARRFLSETGDFQEALKRFPKHLGYENSMLNHLAKNPTDHIGALRKLPKKLRWMFVHAYQSYIFNLSLSEHIRHKTGIEKLPLAGSEIKLDDTTAEILKEKSIPQEAFRIKEMPELSSEGVYRNCFIEVKDLEILDTAEDELNKGRNKMRLRFSIPKGGYATAFLREIMKNECW